MEKLSEGEFRLMEVLWDAQPVNSTKLVHLCEDRLNWNKSTTYTVLRKVCQKGAAKNEKATVSTLLTREQVVRARGEDLTQKAGGVVPFLTAFLSGRKLTEGEAQELKALIDANMGKE